MRSGLFLISVLFVFLVSSCVPLEFSKTASHREQANSQDGELGGVQDFLDYSHFLHRVEPQYLQRELDLVSRYDAQQIDETKKIRVALLALHPDVSVNDLILLKRLMDEPKFVDHNETRILKTLRTLARQHADLRLHNSLLLQEKKAVMEKYNSLQHEMKGAMEKNSSLHQEILRFQKREEDLQNQLQGLKDIEKIITTREKTLEPGGQPAKDLSPSVEKK